MDFSSPEEILHDGGIGKHLTRALEKTNFNSFLPKI